MANGTGAASSRQRIRSGGADRAFSTIIYIFAALSLLVILYPLYFIIIASFSDPSAVSTGQVWLKPAGFTLDDACAVGQHRSAAADQPLPARRHDDAGTAGRLVA